MTSIFEGYMVWYGSKNENHKDIFKNWIVCSNYDNHFRFDNQPNRGDLYDYLMNTIILTLIVDEMNVRAPTFMKKSGDGLHLELQTVLY